jgi:hypothetical protein
MQVQLQNFEVLRISQNFADGCVKGAYAHFNEGGITFLQFSLCGGRGGGAGVQPFSSCMTQSGVGSFDI